MVKPRLGFGDLYMSGFDVSWFDNVSSAVTPVEYDGLIERVPGATVFNSWPWVTACSDHLLSNEAISVLTIRSRDETLIAIALTVVKIENLYGIRTKVARFVGVPYGDRFSLLVDPKIDKLMPVFLDNLINHAPDSWDYFVWNEYLEDAEIDPKIESWAKGSHPRFYKIATSHCPVLPLSTLTREEMEKSYSKNMKTRLRRGRKKLQAAGDVEITHYRPDENKVAALLDEIRAVEERSWKGEDGVGIFSRGSFAFFKDVSQRLAKRQLLDVAEIRINGELATYRYGFCYRGGFLDYNLAFLPEYKKIGLGRILLDEIILSALDNGYSALDGSRVGVNSRHLLFERTEKTVRHLRWYWYSNSFKGLCIQFIIEFAKPMGRKWRDKINALLNDKN